MDCGKIILSHTCKLLREFRGVAVNRDVQMCILFSVSARFQEQVIYLLAGMSVLLTFTWNCPLCSDNLRWGCWFAYIVVINNKINPGSYPGIVKLKIYFEEIHGSFKKKLSESTRKS